MHVVGVGAVLTNDRAQVLLVRTLKAGWELPGGRVEEGEDLIGALERELYEEASTAATIGPLVGAYAWVNSGLLIVIFRGTSDTLAPAPSDGEEKVLEAGWFNQDEALRRVTHVGEREALSDALSGAPGVIYRAYNV